MKILAIIASYNFEKWLDACLGSLRQSTCPVDVLVVDNRSLDQTVARLRADYPEVRLVENPANMGFGKANNIGLEMVLKEGYDAAFLINQDATVEPNTIELLVQAMENHPEYGIFSPVHYNGTKEMLDKGFAGYVKKPTPQDLPQGKEVVKCKFINAALWLVSRKVIEKVGGFSPIFYHYGEDKDYVNRLRYHGFLLGYVPCAAAMHYRADRRVTSEQFFHSEEIYLLSEYVNIRHNIFFAFGYAVLGGVHKAWRALLRNRMNEATKYLRITSNVFTRTDQVMHYRKLHRQPGANFLLQDEGDLHV